MNCKIDYNFEKKKQYSTGISFEKNFNIGTTMVQVTTFDMIEGRAEFVLSEIIKRLEEDD